MKLGLGKRKRPEYSDSDYDELDDPKFTDKNCQKSKKSSSINKTTKSLPTTESKFNDEYDDFAFDPKIWKTDIENLTEDDIPNLEKFVQEVTGQLLALESYKVDTNKRKLKMSYMLEIKWIKEFLSDLVKKQKSLNRIRQSRLKRKKINPYTYGAYAFIPRMYRYNGEVDIGTGLPEGQGELIYFYTVKDTSFVRDENVTVDKYMNVVHYKGEVKHGGPHGDNCNIKFSNNKTWYEGAMNRGWFHGQGKDFYLTGELKYQGFYKNGGPHGMGVTVNGCAGFAYGWRGDMCEGKREGLGREIDEKGNTVRILRCRDDQIVEIINDFDLMQNTNKDFEQMLKDSPDKETNIKWYPYRTKIGHIPTGAPKDDSDG